MDRMDGMDGGRRYPVSGAEAARMLGISAKTLQRSRRPERFPQYAEMHRYLAPSRTIVGKWVYFVDRIEGWLELNRVGLKEEEIEAPRGKFKVQSSRVADPRFKVRGGKRRHNFTTFEELKQRYDAARQ